jgi:hypothetical protein
MSDTYTITTVNGVVQPTIMKDPNAILDYTVDWVNWLAEISDALSSHSVICPAGITCTSSVISGTGVVIWLSGGTEGTTYQIVCRVVTDGGRTDDRSIFIQIKER